MPACRTEPAALPGHHCLGVPPSRSGACAEMCFKQRESHFHGRALPTTQACSVCHAARLTVLCGHTPSALQTESAARGSPSPLSEAPRPQRRSCSLWARMQKTLLISRWVSGRGQRCPGRHPLHGHVQPPAWLVRTAVVRHVLCCRTGPPAAPNQPHLKARAPSPGAHNCQRLSAVGPHRAPAGPRGHR